MKLKILKRVAIMTTLEIYIYSKLSNLCNTKNRFDHFSCCR